MRHETPAIVASLLARHAPKRLDSLLDPSTGTGVLVRPFLETNPKLRVTCVDIDRAATRLLGRELKIFPNVKVIPSDFLTWGKGAVEGTFDCVVMNPPFAARKEHQVRLRVPGADGGLQEMSVAVEMAFVHKAISLLRPGGRLLGILPASVVSAESGLWLRRLLMQSGAVRLVHELPSRTFAGVEGKIFLFVYEHGASQARVALRNHRLQQPDQLAVSRKLVEETVRFDFAFHESLNWYRRLLSFVDLGWVPAPTVVDCWRGEVASPITDKSVLHTTNFLSFSPSLDRKGGLLQRPVRSGDLVVRRVGRSCSESWLPYYGIQEAGCSDCILVVRPKDNVDSLRLLFALRVLLADRKGAPLVEYGVGACYITLKALDSIKVPMMLAFNYPGSFEQFRHAVEQEMWHLLPGIERRVRGYLQRR